MSQLSEIKRLWAVFVSTPFPTSAAGIEIGGVDLALIDTLAAGCIETALATGGALDDERRVVLTASMSNLGRVLPSLNGETVNYFAQLHRVGTLVLARAHPAPTS